MRHFTSLFKALTEETRLRILLLLSKQELCVNDLVRILQLPQSTVSRHLAHLRTAGWIIDRRQGICVYYSLVRSNVDLQRRLMFLLEKELFEEPRIEQDFLKLDQLLADARRNQPPQ